MSVHSGPLPKPLVLVRPSRVPAYPVVSLPQAAVFHQSFGGQAKLALVEMPLRLEPPYQPLVI